MGLAWIIGAVLIWHSWVGWPLDEFRLIQGASTSRGVIIDAWEEADSGEGGTRWLHSAKYRFTLPDGRSVVTETPTRQGRLKAGIGPGTPIEVEYLPNDPDVNRIKGDGSSGVVEWVLRKLLLGTALLVLMAAPGFVVARNALRGWIEGGTDTRRAV